MLHILQMKRDQNNLCCVIAIDGPAASGKSTIAKLLADKLGFIHVDSGAIYRTLTLAMIEELGSGKDRKQFGERFNQSMKTKRIDLKSLSYKLKIIDKKQVHFLNGKDVGDAIRSPQVTERIHYVASDHSCREWVNEKLKALGSEENIIVDGRDIGTVVFPKTPFKFFIEASVDVRAQRRLSDLQKVGYNNSLDTIKEEIKKRDEEDRNRDFGALQAAPNAVYLDSSHDTAKDITAKIAAQLQFKF